MPAECNLDPFEFARVEGRKVVAGFDGGSLTSDAGALLLGATDRAINLVGRLADCFPDARKAELVEHEVATLVGQRVFAMALGYEDLNDHDELLHDPVMAILAGKLAARRDNPAQAAQDRRPGHCLGAKDQAGHDLRPSLARRMGRRARPIIQRPLSPAAPPSPVPTTEPNA